MYKYIPNSPISYYYAFNGLHFYTTSRLGILATIKMNKMVYLFIVDKLKSYLAKIQSVPLTESGEGSFHLKSPNKGNNYP
jgi:hypothetical protein